MAPSNRQRNHTSSPNPKKDNTKKNPRKSSGNIRKEEIITNQEFIDQVGLFYPSNDTAFKALLSARFCAAVWSHISDCDETYNYWEPSHYLLFGKGMQTWEYSPEFALRSYTYLMIHVVPAWLYHVLLQPNKMLMFYFSRCLLGLCCALCEVYFYKSVCREFGIHVARVVLVALLFNAGMFISSTAFLPSSFSMYMTLLSLGAWYQRKYELAVFATALSAFLSWPFAVLIGVPIAVDLLFRRKDWWLFIQWSLIACVAILLPMARIDSLYYGRLVVAPLNIVMYNVFTSHGPDLYGTEPWYFYFINGFLNFNIIFIAALFTPLALVAVKLLVPVKLHTAQFLPYWLSLAPLYLWLLVFCLQPHKEERFLFPVYPLICLCGGVTIDCVQKLWFRLVVKSGIHYLNHTMFLLLPALAITSLLGLSRTLALYKGYSAPMDVFIELNKLTAEGGLSPEQNINICMGKEWYRYPSSFFLPSDNWQLRFLQSEFRGQLPQSFSQEENGTMLVPENMNDANKEEPSRYVDVSSCHFIVDLDTGTETEREPNYSQQTEKWAIVKSVPFLDAARSHKFFRAFYIPVLWERHCQFSNYNLLKAKKHTRHNHNKPL
ncbi:alpha-1,2-mannosyltransferase ALG9 isoform X1 [Homalodisca vitripennis]|uniref:alpha-1,2-mannosyltransferase ALG9 isoform X1 n=2 Tax=Homalodisca vitripennis TaxID=197043 RepID=UPI001EE9F3A8|nr:alpha-1,2-mannosyltransferase ALG9 isoform X1 [Homalodisca vitripennis]